MATENKTPEARLAELEAERDRLQALWDGPDTLDMPENLRQRQDNLIQIDIFKECMELQAANEPHWDAMFSEAGFSIAPSEFEQGMEHVWYMVLEMIHERQAANVPDEAGLTDEEITDAYIGNDRKRIKRLGIERYDREIADAATKKSREFTQAEWATERNNLQGACEDQMKRADELEGKLSLMPHEFDDSGWGGSRCATCTESEDHANHAETAKYADLVTAADIEDLLKKAANYLYSLGNGETLTDNQYMQVKNIYRPLFKANEALAAALAKVQGE